MRTQKYTKVEAIVAKYKKLAVEDKNVKWAMDSMESQLPISFDPNILIFEMQLLCQSYVQKAKDDTSVEVLDLCKPYVRNYIKGLISSDEEMFLTDNFDILVDYLLGNRDSWQLRSIYDSSIEEWSELVPHLLQNKGKILIPCSDGGREFTGLNGCELYVADDFLCAAFRAYANKQCINHYTLKHNHEMFERIEDNSFDAVIYDMSNSFKIDSELLHIYRVTCDGGEILISMSKESLLQDNTLEFRKMLSTKREISEVISLPSGDVLLHIVKSPQDTFVMADGSDITKEKGWVKKSKSFDTRRFIELVKYADKPEFDDKPICRRYEYSALCDNVLLPSYYLYMPQEGTPLRSFISEARDIVFSEDCESEEKVVTINNLSKTFSRSEFSVEDLKTIDTTRARSYKRISGPCVVFVVSEGGIAAGYNLESKPFLVPNNLYALQTNDILDAKFICGFICGQEGQRQISLIIAGKGIRSFLSSNWDLFVHTPQLTQEGKRDFVDKLIQSDFSAQEELTKNAYENHIKDIRLRKHALSQNISAFDSIYVTLERCFREQGGRLKAADPISPIGGMTVSDAFTFLSDNLKDICNRVNHLTDDENWGNCENIEPVSFIESYEKNHTGINYKFENNWEPYETNVFAKDQIHNGKIYFHEGDPKTAAWFPKAALIQVFDNILSNAIEHGFTDHNRKDYVISFGWSTDGLNMILEISNNGSPINESMDPNNILLYGYSSSLNQNGHGGIGGGQIADIMHKYGGDVKVISTPKESMTVTYALSLPLASNY